MGFQKHVNAQPAPGEAGDFAGTNPRMSVPVGGQGFVVGSDALIVGRFAWGNPTTGKAESNSANGGIVGFVHRENQTIITAFLGEQRVAVETGFPVTLMSQGEFWADFGTAGGDAGDPVYANNTTGVAQVASSGGTLTNYVLAQDVPVPAVSNNDATMVLNTGVLIVPTGPASGVFEVGQKLTWSGQADDVLAVITGQIDATHYSTTYVNRAAVSARVITGTAGTLGKISSWIQPSP